jgi:hypothetical protein
MNKENLSDNDQNGIPDEQMPELTEEDFVRAGSNRFIRTGFQLDDDVLAYFKTEREVNEALRLVIRLNQIISHK